MNMNRDRHILLGAVKTRYPVMYAATCGSAYACYVLILSGYDPTDPDNRPLGIACRAGYTEVVALLLSDRRVDPTLDRNRVLKIAIAYDQTEVIRLLLSDRRIDPLLDDNSCVLAAVYWNKPLSLQALLEDSRIRDATSDIGLVIDATRVGNSEIVSLLTMLPAIANAWSKPIEQLS